MKEIKQETNRDVMYKYVTERLSTGMNGQMVGRVVIH